MLKQLTKDLIQVYVGMISADHHKTRDGCFSISLDYCAYHDQDAYYWNANHEGYINQKSVTANSFEEAEHKLQEMVCEFIDEEIDVYTKASASPDEYDVYYPTDMPELISKFNSLKEQVYAY